MLARQQATGGATNVLASAAVAAADMDGGEGWGDDDLDDFWSDDDLFDFGSDEIITGKPRFGDDGDTMGIGSFWY